MDIDDKNDDLNLKKDIYSIVIKAMLTGVKIIGLEEYLKKHFESCPGISPFELFQTVIFNSLLAVEFAIKEKDNKLIKDVDALIKKLEDEQVLSLGKLFSNILIKAKKICEGGARVSHITFNSEFTNFMNVFRKKMTTDNKKRESCLHYYSNN